jgi:hypothetical protein
MYKIGIYQSFPFKSCPPASWDLKSDSNGIVRRGLQFFLKFVFMVCVHTCMCVSMCTWVLLSMGAKSFRSSQVIGSCELPSISTETEPRSSARAVCALNHWAIHPSRLYSSPYPKRQSQNCTFDNYKLNIQFKLLVRKRTRVTQRVINSLFILWLRIKARWCL